MKYTLRPEVVLGNIPEVDIPEMQVTYNRNSGKFLSGAISSSEDVAAFLRGLFGAGEIELQEQFLVLYLNQANRVIGYYKHSKGSINATVADTRIILGTALKCACVSMIISHNHPSGNLLPSRADQELTRRLKEGAALMDIRLLDHLIVTKDGYFSFADDGLIGLEGLRKLADPSASFVAAVVQDLEARKEHNKTSIEKLAHTFGIEDKTEVKELTELAIVNRARAIADNQFSEDRFHQIISLYESQVNLSHRTSQSILLQQYSTPAPIGYLAGAFCGLQKGVNLFEPSAGNGLLTILARPDQCHVNEIDPMRRHNLETQGFLKVTAQDATQPFRGLEKQFMAVITNPPFGQSEIEVLYDTFPIKPLEHVMALRALDCMRDNGRAAIIIGGRTHWDEKGRIQAGKNRIFFNFLYSRYHVADVININGKKLYSRQGTSFDTRLILIKGRKLSPAGAAPVYNPVMDQEVITFDDLYDRVVAAMQDQPAMKTLNTDHLEQEALALQDLFDVKGLGAPYEPASQSCVVLNTQVPDSMASETRKAILDIKSEVGGDIDNFVRHRLKYTTKAALCKVLSAEQIDAVAMAIYNIEARGQGMIIGDQTGIGKGRVAAAMIRYAVVQGYKPVFLTEKANLFSDIYRDLSAIGSAHLRPFIVNTRESKTDIKDEDGNVIYQAPAITEQNRIMQERLVPANYDFVVATYSQFNSPEKKPEKPALLRAIAPDNIFILDEAHNSSGSSNTGEFLQHVVAGTKGVVFLSATFAKRPDNMPIYAMKTSIADCNMSKDDLVEAITRGGVALQEVLSSQLVAEGQMLRRERSFEGVEVNYISLDEKAEEHKAIADNITDILRDIISFQGKHINKQVEELDKIAVAEGKEVEVREGTSQAGVDNQPYFSKVFQVINQMLFSLKAESVAERTIQRLREGKKPVIAFASTMGSFIEGMENNFGAPVADGDTINADFSEILKRGLDGILRYTEKDVDGNPVFKRFEVPDLPPETQAEYYRILDRIKAAATGITISPIDVIIKRLKDAGYSVAEVTGRKFELQINPKTGKGLMLSRKKVNTNDAFRQFNNNEVDVLMINQSGSTGASAHAIPTAKVPKEQVRQRVMIVLQAELDINTEVQKRGRINRTGQVLKPIYDYVTSAIPAEKRLMMMLQKKLKSLDANTASNQKQSTKILDVPDFLNKYGDKIVKDYLMENPEVNELLDDPLKLKDSNADSGSEATVTEDAAHKVSGRVAVLSTKMQQDFYNEIAERYSDYVDYLRQVGEYDLEVEAMNLEAEIVASKVVKMGKGSDSAFGDDSLLETVRANVLKKPFSRVELENLVQESLKGKEAKEQQKELIQEYSDFVTGALEAELASIDTKYEELIDGIEQEKALIKIREKQGTEAFLTACQERKQELEEAWQSKKEQTKGVFENRKGYLMRMFRFFYVGRGLNYPIETYTGGNELVPAVFLGFTVDPKKKNPFAPSAIKVRFAIANSSKYFAVPASYSEDIMAIIGASSDVAEHSLSVHLSSWEEYTAQNNVDRRIRHIITGNLLQAFSDFKGKLVAYTTLEGDTRKGILMPENWNPTEQVADKVVIPIIKSLPLIRSLTHGGQMVANNGLSFFRYGNYFKLIISASRSRGGDIYLDRQLMELVDKGVFEKVSDKMVAMLPVEALDKAIQVLQVNHSLSMTIHSYQLRDLKTEGRLSTRKKIQPPEPEEATDASLLELEAEALILELQLLAA
ncbi:JAB domain-containing protein [Flaviaesturariibacter aridisoli]|uniref:Helicase ATP-binding domain-containing protein n=1 Tax=Flaviaesturariibacter aridisoli TaxID=2545761 RepID=A0A4R4DW91_9BACT|nr:JAB domain-containing protein [Flaviaesturariibacter aridisoli]TCZ68345.1 hypothetical protein E0486_14230 [Flaviaesturariibacter aridisoli]